MSSSEYNKIFEKLVGPDNDSRLNILGAMAYGLYKVAKREWVKEFRGQYSRAPNEAELKNYVATWTPTRLDGLRQEAAGVLAEFAETVVDEEAPRIREGALRGTFVRGVGQSMLATLLYTLLLIAVVVILTVIGIDLQAALNALKPASST